MQKRILINLVIVSLCSIILSTSVLYVIQTMIKHKEINDMFSIQLVNMAERIQDNKIRVNELTEATREDYLSRARALAMMIEMDPTIIEDSEKLNNIVWTLDVDEIHVIDNDGILRWGTEPNYYGKNFITTEQTAPFLEILKDPSLEIAQDAMPNGFAGLMRQYTGVALHSTGRIAQIGMVPERFEEALKDTQIDNLLKGNIIGNTGYMFAVSSDTQEILSHPNPTLMGEIINDRLDNEGILNLDKAKMIYQTLEVDDIILVATISSSEMFTERIIYTYYFLGFSILMFGTIVAIVNLYIKKNVIDGIYNTLYTLEEITNGNLNIVADVTSGQEFTKLSDGINQMLHSIKIKMSEVSKLGAIVAIADAGIIVKDKDGIVLEWNIGAENILGYKPNEIIGKSSKAYAPEEEHAGIDKIESLLRVGEHIEHVEVIRKHKNGKQIYCSSSYTPILEDGVFTGSVAIFHDISDKKQIEKALQDAVMTAKQANDAKSLFLANMSHEIRTPMNGIIGFAELALDDNTMPDKKRDYLEKIKVSGVGLLQIINDILDISKIEAGKMELERIPFCIADIFELCKVISAPKADEKGIIMYFYNEENDESFSRILLGDPTKIRQVLINLISNAIKFTNKGMVKVMAVVENLNEHNAVIRFEVKDNGIGMSKEHISKIFEPFIQADSSTTREFGGTGLGLAITKSMIELMGGSLNVESNPGVGSRFSFTLTLDTASFSDDTLATNIGVSIIKKPLFKGEVLVCEDNLINQQVIEGHLSRVGLTATIVENGKQGIEAVSNKQGSPFDLILMDMHMPVMDGMEASKILINMGIETPIIALTANVMEKDKKTYFNIGMSGYLAKPFVTQELWACLLKYLTPLNTMNEYDSKLFKDKYNNIKKEYIIDTQLGIERSGENEELYNKLLKDFVRDNKQIINKIKDAISLGDIKEAHRKVHTLKSVAGTLGAIRLQEAAYTVEQALLDNKNSYNDGMILYLEEQLSKVFNEIELIHILHKDTKEQEEELLDNEQAILLINELLPLLKSCNMQCLDLLPNIKSILTPVGEESEILIKQIEDCDFEPALETANRIIKII